MKFFRQILMNQAGEGTGAGGAAAAPAAPAAPQAPAAPAAPPVAPPANPIVRAGAEDDTAPVTRGELKALMAKLDALAKPAEPKAAPAPTPAGGAPAGGESLIAALADEVRALRQEREQDRSQSVRKQLVDVVLAGVPEANRSTADAVVQHIIASTGMKIDGSISIDASAKNLQALLRANHANLYAEAGSSRSAVQVGPNGRLDYSGVRNLSELTPEQIRQISDDDFDRIVRGTNTSDGASIPRNIFQRRR